MSDPMAHHGALYGILHGKTPDTIRGVHVGCIELPAKPLSQLDWVV